MRIDVRKTVIGEVAPLRDLYRLEANCQIRHYGSLSRGFADPYLILVDGRVGGYGAVYTKHYEGRLMEFYSFPHVRIHSLPMFRELLAVSAATEVAAQSNMPLEASMLRAVASDIVVECILFDDAAVTDLTIPSGEFRARRSDDEETNKGEPEGDWVIAVDGAIAANGGFLTHYNPPYADIYMETAEPFRRQGYGSYLVQELKRASYESGKKPAARCDPGNVASRKTLERAGLMPVADLLVGLAPK